VRVLVADVGGTKTLFALVEVAGGRFAFLREKRFESREAESLAELAARFLGEVGGAERAAFAVAAPVTGEVSEGPNLPWKVVRSDLAAAIGIPRTEILNDLEAVGRGIEHLAPEDLFALQEGMFDLESPAALVGAGTGLGEAFLLPFGGRRRVFPTEGGHADFAPRTDLEWDLFRFARERFRGRVSVERILSGSGIALLYDFLVEGGHATPDEEVRGRIAVEDPAAVISRAALEGRCEASVRALDLFASIYGAEAGNLALRILARGGIYLAGGIAPRILEKLREGTFLEAFMDKGRFRPLLHRIPVRVILSPRAPLLGAAAALIDPAG
jgi:glucokinase